MSFLDKRPLTWLNLQTLLFKLSPIGADLRLIATDINQIWVFADRQPATQAICLYSWNCEGKKQYVYWLMGQGWPEPKLIITCRNLQKSAITFPGQATPIDSLAKLAKILSLDLLVAGLTHSLRVADDEYKTKGYVIRAGQCDAWFQILENVAKLEPADDDPS